ncbi:MAG: hypothetical protein IKQ97_04850 [Eubacterium sp.]|jgi:hypothetical protein|nr:hypothetical protein [Eubacterium sp.]
MRYEKTSLPENVRKYLEEIYNDDELRDAFYDCDVEIYDEDWIRDLENDDSWLEDLMGPGESSYDDLKPFARDGSGALWVVIDDVLIGYIGTEGECGIVARNVDEFMNIIAMGRYVSDYCSADLLKSEDAFLDGLAGLEDYNADNKEVIERFIKKHGFTRDPRKLYKMIVQGLTVRPFFEIKATDDDYGDSYSLLGCDDGQNSLEQLIKLLGL